MLWNYDLNCFQEYATSLFNYFLPQKTLQGRQLSLQFSSLYRVLREKQEMAPCCKTCIFCRQQWSDCQAKSCTDPGKIPCVSHLCCHVSIHSLCIPPVLPCLYSFLVYPTCAAMSIHSLCIPPVLPCLYSFLVYPHLCCHASIHSLCIPTCAAMSLFIPCISHLCCHASIHDDDCITCSSCF